MPVTNYECLLILDPNRVAGDQTNAVKQVHAILERNNAEVLASKPWGEQKLAYPINNHKKGLYHLTYFRTEGKNISAIERDFRLNETILRCLIVRIHPKHIDDLLNLARDEGPMALQTVFNPPPEEEALNNDRPERTPRRGGSGRGRSVEKEEKEAALE